MHSTVTGCDFNETRDGRTPVIQRRRNAVWARPFYVIVGGGGGDRPFCDLDMEI